MFALADTRTSLVSVLTVCGLAPQTEIVLIGENIRKC